MQPRLSKNVLLVPNKKLSHVAHIDQLSIYVLALLMVHSVNINGSNHHLKEREVFRGCLEADMGSSLAQGEGALRGLKWYVLELWLYTKRASLYADRLINLPTLKRLNLSHFPPFRCTMLWQNILISTITSIFCLFGLIVLYGKLCKKIGNTFSYVCSSA